MAGLQPCNHFTDIKVPKLLNFTFMLSIEKYQIMSNGRYITE